MKLDGPGRIINHEDKSLHHVVVNRGFTLIDTTTSLTALIRGIRETEGDFDIQRYNSEVEMFRNRRVVRIKQGRCILYQSLSWGLGTFQRKEERNILL